MAEEQEHTEPTPITDSFWGYVVKNETVSLSVDDEGEVKGPSVDLSATTSTPNTTNPSEYVPGTASCTVSQTTWGQYRTSYINYGGPGGISVEGVHRSASGLSVSPSAMTFNGRAGSASNNFQRGEASGILYMINEGGPCHLNCESLPGWFHFMVGQTISDGPWASFSVIFWCDAYTQEQLAADNPGFGIDYRTATLTFTNGMSGPLKKTCTVCVKQNVAKGAGSTEEDEEDPDPPYIKPVPGENEGEVVGGSGTLEDPWQIVDPSLTEEGETTEVPRSPSSYSDGELIRRDFVDFFDDRGGHLRVWINQRYSSGASSSGT